jgi:hypothetical protein
MIFHIILFSYLSFGKILRRIFIYIIWYDNINLGEREVEEKYSKFLDWLIEDISWINRKHIIKKF